MTQEASIRKFLHRAAALVQSREDKRAFLALVNAVLDDGLLSPDEREKLRAELKERSPLEHRTNGDYEEVWLNGECIAADNNIQGNEMLEALADALGFKVKTIIGEWEWDGKDNRFVPNPPDKD